MGMIVTNAGAEQLMAGLNVDDIIQNLEDITTIDHYRVALRQECPPNSFSRYLLLGEVNPFCDELYADDLAKYKTPEEAEEARDAFVLVNNAVGLATDAVVVAVNAFSTALAIDGQFVSSPEDHDDIPI